jgi:formamidase
MAAGFSSTTTRKLQSDLGPPRDLQNSRHIPGVRWVGVIHPGLIGCLPDRELLERANSREAELLATNPDRVPLLLAPPYAPTALMGQMTGRTAKQEMAELAEL